ncbi:MAG: hypothetical protein ACK4NP_06295 [Parvularculaceae bacterium]
MPRLSVRGQALGGLALATKSALLDAKPGLASQARVRFSAILSMDPGSPPASGAPERRWAE